MRKILALLGLACGITGLLLNVLDISLHVGVGGEQLGTHPLTALLIVVLSVGLLNYRIGQPTPAWRYAIGLAALAATFANLWHPDLMHQAFLPWSATADSRMGQDTSILLGLLFGSVVLRRYVGRIGLALALSAMLMVCFSVIGHSYDVHYLDGHMALTTIIALIPVTLSVLSLYAHYPALRPVLVADENGTRTRSMILIGFLVPWAGGLVLYQGFGVPERALPIEAIILGLIACSMVTISVYSGFIYERADKLRRSAERQMAFAAIHDRLTGTLNRAGLNDALDRLWDRFVRTGHGTGVILMDLDHFKQINDTHGHPAGDSVLEAVGAALAPVLRSRDVIGRWGGEEFVILIDGVDQIAVEAIGERLRIAMKGLPQIIAARVADRLIPFEVSASFGASVFQEEDNGFSDALSRADIGLYKAKAAGRDRVVFQSGSDQASAA